MIELMIVLGVIAILVAIAVPAYQNYTVRSKIAECVNEAAVAKLTISEYRQTLGAWPPSLLEAGLIGSGDTKYCTGFNNYQKSSGAFAIDIDEAAVDPDLPKIEPVLTPFMTLSGMINWRCSRGTTAEDDIRYLPASCRGS